MKKRLEDRLIELAFEERAEAGVAEIASTPEAAARLKQYQAMRSALGQLRDIPEHQLSTERLREALLHRGLKRRSSFPWQALGYAGTACALFVCAYFVSRNVRRANAPTPQLELTAMKDRNDSRVPELKAAPAASSYPWSGNLATAPVVDRRSHIGSHAVRTPYVAVNPTGHIALNLVHATGPVDKPTGAKSGVASNVELAGNRMPASSTPANTALVSNAMVLIQQKTDADTGLDTAQEVTATGDVLVGG